MFKYVAVGICFLTLNKFCLESEQFKYQKIRTRKTSYSDISHTMLNKFELPPQ